MEWLIAHEDELSNEDNKNHVNNAKSSTISDIRNEEDNFGSIDSPMPSASASTSYHNSDDVRPPIAPIRQILNPNPTGYPAPAEMPTRRYNTRSGPVSDVYDAFRDFQAEAQWQEMAQDGVEMSASDSSQNYANRKRTLQELFRPPLELMFRGSLDSARETGQTKNKWLLVNIQNGQEFACQIMNRDVWSNQTVKDILKEHFIFWQVYHDSYEGRRYVQFYNVSKFPHVAIVDPRTGEQMKSWPPTIDHNSFCDSVMEYLTEHSSPDSSEDANSMKKLRVKEEEQQEREEPKPKSQQHRPNPPRALSPPSPPSSRYHHQKHLEQQRLRQQRQKEQEDDEVQVIEDEDVVVVPKPRAAPYVPKKIEGPECKIALRFPDGSSLVQKFSAQEQLASVRLFVQAERSSTNSSNIEFIAPPNRKLTNEMMNETLESLGLCPASRLEVKCVQD